eukprot:jgi/Botrbrau1/15831/Bobra.40_1s0017.1
MVFLFALIQFFIKVRASHMSAVEVAICHMHSDHLQSEAIGSMWAAEEVGKFTIEYYPVLFSYMLDKHVMAGSIGKACMDHASSNMSGT